MAYVNLFKGAAYPIARDHGLVSVFGGWDWLPSGPMQDQALRAALDARDEDSFKARGKILTAESADKGADPAQQYKFLTMRKGDVLVVRDSNPMKKTSPKKYLIGIWNDDFEDDAAVWDSMTTYGVQQCDMHPEADSDGASRKRLWRRVTWLREGAWVGSLKKETISSMAGLQAKTMQEFKKMAPFDDMLAQSQQIDPSGSRSMLPGLGSSQAGNRTPKRRREVENDETLIDEPRKRRKQPVRSGGGGSTSSESVLMPAPASSCASARAPASASARTPAPDDEDSWCVICRTTQKRTCWFHAATSITAAPA